MNGAEWEAERETVAPEDQTWFVFDLDGTLADVAHREALAREKKWNDFNAACVRDIPRVAEAYLARMIHIFTPNNRIMIITGRSAAYRQLAEEWLLEYAIPYDELHMRAVGDHRPDVEVKRQLAFEDGKLGDRNVMFVIEDRDRMVALWRAEGYTCFQCQAGAY
jgi:hypothetical protein